MSKLYLCGVDPVVPVVFSSLLIIHQELVGSLDLDESSFCGFSFLERPPPIIHFRPEISSIMGPSFIKGNVYQNNSGTKMNSEPMSSENYNTLVSGSYPKNREDH